MTNRPAIEREREIRAVFEARMRRRWISLVSEPVVEEHRESGGRDPSPALRAVLIAMRRRPVAGKLVVHESEPGRRWSVLRLSGEPGVPPVPTGAVFESRAAAVHQVFLERVAEWMEAES